MNPDKRPLLLEICHDILEYIFNSLVRERNFDKAAQARKAMKALVDLQSMLKGDSHD